MSESAVAAPSSVITVGQFTYDTVTNTLSGPAAYMAEKGDARLESILAGEDVVFNMSAHLSPSLEVAVLVLLQTDYAGWKGHQEMLGWIKAK